MKYADITTKNLENILKFLPFFANEKNKFFVITKDDFFYSDEVQRFKKALVDEGFISAFDYSEWHLGVRILDENPEMLESVDIVTIQRLFTSIFADDRHVMSAKGARGPFATLIEKGFLLKILYRLEEILKEK